jgi:hypothetical protein
VTSASCTNRAARFRPELPISRIFDDDPCIRGSALRFPLAPAHRTGQYAPVAACGHRRVIVRRAACWKPLVLGLCIAACSSGATSKSTAPLQPSLTVADPATDFCESIATSRFTEFVDAFNHREFALADAMITQDADFWGFAEAPDRRADAVPAPDRSTVRAFLESRAAINEFWVIKGFGYEPYQPTLARPGSFISFAIQVSNDAGVVVRDGKGFVHCATDKIDNFVIGPTLEEQAN